jgi:hypothetical protein
MGVSFSELRRQTDMLTIPSVAAGSNPGTGPQGRILDRQGLQAFYRYVAVLFATESREVNRAGQLPGVDQKSRAVGQPQDEQVADLA